MVHLWTIRGSSTCHGIVVENHLFINEDNCIAGLQAYMHSHTRDVLINTCLAEVYPAIVIQPHPMTVIWICLGSFYTSGKDSSAWSCDIILALECYQNWSIPLPRYTIWTLSASLRYTMGIIIFIVVIIIENIHTPLFNTQVLKQFTQQKEWKKCLPPKKLRI